MDFSIFGASESLRPLLCALAQSDEHHVVGWYASEAMEAELVGLFPVGRRLGNAERIVTAPPTETTVIVGNTEISDERNEVLRELARIGMPMILAHPPCSAIFAFELDMIQADTGALMLPLHVDAIHPWLSTLQQWVLDASTSPVGKIEQIAFERAASTRDNESVRAALARDSLLLRKLIGNFGQVSAMKATTQDTSLANLNVQLTGDHSDMTRWSIGPVSERAGAKLTLHGERGLATLVMPDAGTWTMTVPDASGPESIDFDSQRCILDQLKAAESNNASPNWQDACRAIDLSDLAAESARRGKTLAVHNERLTDEDTFKGMMAAGGCLILLLLPLVLVAISTVEGLRLPYGKALRRGLNTGETTVRLPSDFRKITSVSFPDQGNKSLPRVDVEELRVQQRESRASVPIAFAVDGEQLLLGPAPEEEIVVDIVYEGAFTIWSGWPVLLLTPIAIFLLLQLFKLVFPRREQLDVV